MRRFAVPLFITALLIGSAAASAQTQARSAAVYRCGPNGTDLRDSPCPSGPSASSVVSYDQPSAADARATRQRVAAEAKRAAELEKARREAEAQALKANARATSLGSAKPPAPPASAAKADKRKPPKPPKGAKTAHAPAKSASQAAR
jgi:hypothetical protein